MPKSLLALNPGMILDFLYAVDDRGRNYQVIRSLFFKDFSEGSSQEPDFLKILVLIGSSTAIFIQIFPQKTTV